VIDAGDPSGHVARVDYIDRLLDNIPIPSLDAMTFHQTRECDQQLLMAKWDFGLAGSSSHIHMSLAKAGKNVFVDGKDGNESRRHGTAYLLEQLAANLPD